MLQKANAPQLTSVQAVERDLLPEPVQALCTLCDYQHLVCYHVPWQIFSLLGPSETKVVTVLFKKAIPFVSQTTQFSKGKVFHRAHPLVSQKRAYNIKFA